jgi:hypothetical protein
MPLNIEMPYRKSSLQLVTDVLCHTIGKMGICRTWVRLVEAGVVHARRNDFAFDSIGLRSTDVRFL